MHRLVVVNEEEKVIGIISLSDLLMYIVLRPTGEGGSSLRNAMKETSIGVIDENEENQSIKSEHSGKGKSASAATQYEAGPSSANK